MKVKVAVVILNWNGRKMLERFLPNVVSYSECADVAVYVADNGSTDDSVALLEQKFPSVQRILLPENYGFAEGYNKALVQIEATYYVLLNSDVEVTDGWLQPLVSYMDSHPQTAACQPKLLDWNRKEMFEYAGGSGGYIDRYGYPYCRGRIFGTLEKDCGQYEDVASVFWASGAALFIRSADYKNAGGLDGRFFAHMEEIDLCWRLRSMGRKIVCVPQSVVYHVGGGTLKRESPRKTFLNFRNNLLMLYKNLPDEELGSVLRIRRWLDYLAALFFLLKGHLSNAREVIKARRAFLRECVDYRSERQRNLQRTVLPSIPERYPISILKAYYLKRQCFFSQLKQW